MDWIVRMWNHGCSVRLGPYLCCTKFTYWVESSHRSTQCSTQATSLHMAPSVKSKLPLYTYFFWCNAWCILVYIRVTVQCSAVWLLTNTPFYRSKYFLVKENVYSPNPVLSLLPAHVPMLMQSIHNACSSVRVMIYHAARLASSRSRGVWITGIYKWECRSWQCANF